MKVRMMIRNLRRNKGRIPTITLFLTLIPDSNNLTFKGETVEIINTSSPTMGETTLVINNPDLFHKFKIGQEFFVDYQF